MCGIAGAVNWGDLESLVRMTHIQTHRGPDDWGVYETVTPDGRWVGLGARRLSVVDRSPAGHMPMANSDGTIRIVYNGEIYNYAQLRKHLEDRGHRFRSTSDTEAVLLLYQEYGPECLSRLEGMFAFAIWDARLGRLFLARDHFGVKPLYYCARDGRFAFASEIKALLEVPGCTASVDRKGLNQYLTLLWVPDPATLFEGIVKLPAGHYAVYEDAKLRVVPYWDLTLPPADHHFPRSEVSLKAELRMRIDDAVASELRSDVPVGAFLSAGLDSSTIVASMARSANGAAVKTYTIAFPPALRVGESTLDDPRVAAGTAAHFGCDHTEIIVEASVVSLLPKLVWHMDEPVADPALIMAYLVSREARRTVTVLLSGVGGDELLAGYRKHAAYVLDKSYRRLPAALRHRVIEPLLLGLPTMRGTRAKGTIRLLKKMARAAGLSPDEAFLRHSTYLDSDHRARLYTKEAEAEIRGVDPLAQHYGHLQKVRHADFVNQMLYLDMKTFMVSLNLTYNDKMSMASSVEVRVPFLTRSLAEWTAWHVPPSMKLNGANPTTKHLLRAAMKDILPPAVLRQPKAGFGGPTDHWLTFDLREMVHDLLAEDRVRRRGYFEPASVAALLREHYSGREDWSLQIWQLLTFELWLQTFVDASAGARVREAPDSLQMAPR